MTARTPDPCTKSDWDGEMIGDACPECGHTNVVHPGTQNPAVEKCVLCVLEAQAGEDDL